MYLFASKQKSTLEQEKLKELDVLRQDIARQQSRIEEEKNE
jgi:hypothetical protein